MYLIRKHCFLFPYFAYVICKVYYSNRTTTSILLFRYNNQFSYCFSYTVDYIKANSGIKVCQTNYIIVRRQDQGN